MQNVCRFATVKILNVGICAIRVFDVYGVISYCENVTVKTDLCYNKHFQTF